MSHIAVAPSMLLRLSTKPKVDRPKSVSLMWPSALISRLSGFRSLWMMPCRSPVVRYCNPGCRSTLPALVQILLKHKSDGCEAVQIALRVEVL